MGRLLLKKKIKRFFSFWSGCKLSTKLQIFYDKNFRWPIFCFCFPNKKHIHMYINIITCFFMLIFYNHVYELTFSRKFWYIMYVQYSVYEHKIYGCTIVIFFFKECLILEFSYVLQLSINMNICFIVFLFILIMFLFLFVPT